MATRKPTEVRRTEIADAALGVVAVRGIAALSTQVLADAVGLTTGALFKHFPSRDALLLGMAERVRDLLRGTYPEGGLPPRERLHRLAEARLALVAGSAGVLTLVLSEQFALALPDEAACVLRAAIAETHSFVARALRDGQAEGSVRVDVAAEALAVLFMGALQMTALARRTGAVPGTLPAIDALDLLIRPLHPGEAVPRFTVPLLAGVLAAGSAVAAPPSGLHPVEVAPPAAEGAPKEVTVLADLPAVKIVAITLRAGTPLPEHTAPVPVTLQAAYGAAVLSVAGATTPLAQGSFVVLDAGTPHAVIPVDGSPVTVLVHHHKAGAP